MGEGIVIKHTMGLGAVLVAGLIIGFIPAWKAYRNTLSDGLSVRL
jgi:putative ABC transport system permease protein